MDDDARVVQRVLNGDRDAFEVLVRRYSRQVFAVVGRHVPAEAVESTAQEAFISAFRSLGLYEPEQSFDRWLLRLARRRCCDYWRRRQRDREICDAALSDDQSSLLEAVSAAQAQDAFSQDCRREESAEHGSRALGCLSPVDGLLVECIYFDRLALPEVAATLDWSLAKVKVRAFRVRKRLRQIIERLSSGG